MFIPKIGASYISKNKNFQTVKILPYKFRKRYIILGYRKNAWIPVDMNIYSISAARITLMEDYALVIDGEAVESKD